MTMTFTTDLFTTPRQVSQCEQAALDRWADDGGPTETTICAQCDDGEHGDCEDAVSWSVLGSVIECCCWAFLDDGRLRVTVG